MSGDTDSTLPDAAERSALDDAFQLLQGAGVDLYHASQFFRDAQPTDSMPADELLHDYLGVVQFYKLAYLGNLRAILARYEDDHPERILDAVEMCNSIRHNALRSSFLELVPSSKAHTAAATRTQRIRQRLQWWSFYDQARLQEPQLPSDHPEHLITASSMLLNEQMEEEFLLLLAAKQQAPNYPTAS